MRRTRKPRNRLVCLFPPPLDCALAPPPPHTHTPPRPSNLSARAWDLPTVPFFKKLLAAHIDPQHVHMRCNTPAGYTPYLASHAHGSYWHIHTCARARKTRLLFVCWLNIFKRFFFFKSWAVTHFWCFQRGLVAGYQRNGIQSVLFKTRHVMYWLRTLHCVHVSCACFFFFYWMCLSAFVSALGSQEMGRHKLPIIIKSYIYIYIYHSFTPTLSASLPNPV